MCLSSFDKIGHVLMEKIAKKYADKLQLEMSMNIQSPLRRGNLAGTQDNSFERLAGTQNISFKIPPPPSLFYSYRGMQ